MRNVTQSVSLLVTQSPLLFELMSLGIVNYSALARMLLPDVRRLTGKKATKAAIVMALRKLESELADDSSLESCLPIQIRSTSMHSGLRYFVLKLSEHLPKLHVKMLQAVAQQPGQTFHCAFASDHAAFSMSPVLERTFHALSKNEVCTSSRSELSAIRVVFGGKKPNIGRIQHVLLQSLRWKGVEVVAVYSTPKEVTYICPDSQADNALIAIQSVTRKSSWGIW